MFEVGKWYPEKRSPGRGGQKFKVVSLHPNCVYSVVAVGEDGIEQSFTSVGHYFASGSSAEGFDLIPEAVEVGDGE